MGHSVSWSEAVPRGARKAASGQRRFMGDPLRGALAGRPFEARRRTPARFLTPDRSRADGLCFSRRVGRQETTGSSDGKDRRRGTGRAASRARRAERRLEAPMDSPLRVSLVGPCPADLGHGAGGADAVVALLARGLAERGERVEVLTCDFEAGADRLLEVGGVRLHRFGARKRRDRSAFFGRERRWIRRRLAELSPDVVHAHGTDFYADAALRHCAPSVLTVHGERERESAPRGTGLSSRLRSWANALFEGRALSRAGAIVVPNRHVRAALEKRTRGRIHEIPPPIDPAYFALPDVAVAGRLLFVGAIEPRRGLLDLVRALPIVAKERPDVRVHVVGKTTDPAYATAVKAEIERERLDRFVVWRGTL